MRKLRGFTLIELLVVIAIIAILAAILFPVFKAVKEKGRQTACLNNMYQLGKAFRMYIDDFNGAYPMGGACWTIASGYNGDWIWFDGSWNSSSNPWSWRANPRKGAIWKYTNRSKKIYICPSDPHAIDPKVTLVNGKSGGFGLSYCMSSALTEDERAYGDSFQGQGMPALETQIVKPTKTVLLADIGDGVWMKNGTSQWKYRCGDGGFAWFFLAPTAIHCGGANWTFCDGHVKWKNLQQFHDLAFFRSGKPAPTLMPTYTYSEEMQ